MTAPEKLTVHGPEDILGFIPHSLGYWPASSLVAMTLHGKRLGATLRVDLPARDVMAAPGKYLRAVRGYLEADTEADGTLLAVFTSNSGMAAPSEYDALLAALAPVLAETGMPVRDAWYVGDDYWRDAYCTDRSCCPLPGRSVQEIRDSTLNTEMVFRGSSVGPAPEAGPPAPPPVSSLYLAAVREAESAWALELEPRRGSRAQFETVVGLWAGLLKHSKGPLLPEAERDGFLCASLQVPAWRDAVLVLAAAGMRAAEAGAEQFGMFDHGCRLQPVAPPAEPHLIEPALNGAEPAADGLPGAAVRDGDLADELAGRRAVRLQRALNSGLDQSVPAAGIPGYGEVLMGVAPRVPDWPTLNCLDELLGQLAALGGPAAAAALTGQGWIAWCRGRGSYAAAYLGRALEIDPEYRLAALLLELARRGTICGWAARKEAAWQKFQEDPCR